jgi:hypothetical protein
MNLSAPDKIGEEIKDTRENRRDKSVENGDDVNHVLQALGARLIQPCVHFRPALLCCECCSVRHLRRSGWFVTPSWSKFSIAALT